MILQTSAAVALRASHAFVAFLLSVLLARLLGPTQYGVYSYVFALVSILALVAQLGLSRLIVRETAVAAVGLAWGKVRGLWRWADTVTLLLSLALSAIMGLSAWTLSGRVSEQFLHTMAWGCVLLPLIALASLRAGALRGLHKPLTGQLVELSLRPVILIIMVPIAAYFSTAGMTAAYAMMLHVAAAGFTVIAGSWWLHRARPWNASSVPAPEYEIRDWLASSLPLGLVAGMQFVNTRADILILGLFTETGEIGNYQVAVSGAMLVLLGVNAVVMVVSPNLARLHAMKDKAQLQAMATWAARAVLVLTLPVALILAAFGEVVVRFAFGEGYARAYLPLAILAVAQGLFCVFGLAGSLLSMTGNERPAARNAVVTAVVNVLLNFALIPRFGMTGAALATGFSLVLWNALLWRDVRRLLGINSLAFGKPA